MQTMEKIESLIAKGVEAELYGMDFVQGLDLETVRESYNGIGPEFLDPEVREKVSELLSIFEPAALVHDLRNEFSDGTRKGFEYANDEFLKNCLKLADYNYCFINPRRYRARAVARILYKLVSAEKFGWRAWLEAKERHEAKMASGNSAGETKGVNMKKLMMMFVVGAAILMTGCSVTKVNYEKNDKGEVSYRLYRNSHWLKMEGEGMRGGMTQDGNFNFDLEGMKSSPSEEFNRTMQTYTTAFVQLAQIAAAAYNPSSSSASVAKSAYAATPQTTVVNVQPAAEAVKANAATTQGAASTQKAEECADGSCPTGGCVDGACNPQ